MPKEARSYDIIVRNVEHHGFLGFVFDGDNKELYRTRTFKKTALEAFIYAQNYTKEIYTF